jgi:uncharacterized protein (TIGR04551 family)
VVTINLDVRARGEILNNFDLDRGPDPSGELLYPTPLSDPAGQTLSRADIRFRTDLGFFLPSGGLSAKIRIDALDGMSLGSAPLDVPAGTTGQDPDSAVLRVKRAYIEALTPIGLLTVGRTGSQFGMGLVANSGDCVECDSGDAADRIAFALPFLDHIWAVAYDFSSTGPNVPSRSGLRVIDIDPNVWVHTISAAILRYRTDWALARRSAADKFTFDYGAAFSHRWQKSDIPSTYVPVASPVELDSSQVVARGYTATLFDGWVRLVGPGVRVEAEGAVVGGSVDQPSLVPGFQYKDPVTFLQWGIALKSAFGDKAGWFSLGMDGGYASGDSAPGFGAFPKAGERVTVAGEIDGPQASPPYDNTVQNFRFHPDYVVDRILFKEIIGTVTDAFYLTPHASVVFARFGKSSVGASIAGIASFAVEPTSTPSGERPLGIEIDPTIYYRNEVGFESAIEQATLIPLSGLDNPRLDLTARPAQLWRLRISFQY